MGSRSKWSRRAIVAVGVAASSALAVAFVLAAAGGTADAQRRRYRQTTQVYMVQKRIPAKLSEEQLLRWARSNQTKRIDEQRTGEIARRKWQFDLVTSFRQPPNDIEFHVLFYDVHDGPPRFIREMSMFVSDRTQRTYVQQVRLDRPSFRPNRNYEMVITIRREEVARMRFALLGEVEARSGEVSFTDEDTREGAGRRTGTGAGSSERAGDGIERAAE